MQVMTKASKRFGTVYPATPTDYFVYFGKACKGGFESITIHKTQRDGSIKECRTFVVGDVAEYDSFNLSYTGTIEKITEKGIHIHTGWFKSAHGGTTNNPASNKKEIKRLDLNAFCWRNYNFDAAETAKNNAEEMMYI